ncbi:Methyltransferase domain [Chelatococcus sambhunathii]|uniref:Methyltransferase domain n=1 Tax=Chelatococcus sambhunathii TaxID=363953 RepID=A0ABP2A3E4_9HYPH|nr:class I SAM-dependent methyltransferase [Chelatococcus sambhunathii]CUA84083.1 Methyltransferase domain [Chelatococcus sambhunathii]
MGTELSPRLRAIVDALPLSNGLRVLEIGCGPGAMARAIAQRIGDGHVLAIDRSAKVIAQARALSQEEIAAGRLSLRQIAAEEFERAPGEASYDIAVAIRVGALDGRYPEAGRRIRRRLVAALSPQGRLFIDGGDPLREIALDD